MAVQLATAFNTLPRTSTSSATRDSALNRWLTKIGVSGAADLIISFGGIKFTTNDLVENMENGYTIQSCYLEYKGVVTQVFFDGGSAQKVINAGDSDVQSDPILASSFGESSFDAGEEVAVKFIMYAPSLGGSFPTNSATRAGDGGQVILFERATSTVAGIDQPGESTITGNTLPRTAGYSPIVLTSTGTGRALLGIGDSITQGVGDIDTRPGYFSKIVKRAFTENTPIASLNMGIGGATSDLANQQEYKDLYKYGNEAIVAFGTNDFGTAGNGTTASAMSTATMNIISDLRSDGHTRITVAGLYPRTQSTDDWTTIENQTALSDWDALTDETYLYSLNLEANITTADGHVWSQSVRASADTFKWEVDGVTAEYTAVDGTHPSTLGHQFIADDYYATVMSIPTLPTVEAGANINATNGDTVTLSGATASDYDSLAWTCTSGQSPTITNGNTLTPTITFNEVGVHTLRLTATNAEGSTFDALDVDVSAVQNTNQPPVASAGPDQSVAAGVEFILDGTGSQDTDGTIVEWRWTQTEGDTVILDTSTPSQPRATAPSRTSAQTLTFQLITVDNEGAESAPGTVNVNVAAVVLSEILKVIERLDFDLVTQGDVNAYFGRANREVMKLKPSDPTGLALDADGFMMLDSNTIEEVKVIAEGSSISSKTDSINLDGSEMLVRLGDLEASKNGSIYFSIVVFVEGDTKGVVVSSKGSSGNKPMSYVTL